MLNLVLKNGKILSIYGKLISTFFGMFLTCLEKQKSKRREGNVIVQLVIATIKKAPSGTGIPHEGFLQPT